MIEAALVAFLGADANVNGCVGTRIYPLRAFQAKTIADVTAPRITYETTGGDPVRSMDGKSGLVQGQFLIHCWGDGDNGYLDAKNLANLVRNATGGNQATPVSGYAILDGFRGVMGGVTVQGVFLGRDQDDYEPPVHADDLGIYKTTLPATIWFDETQ